MKRTIPSTLQVGGANRGRRAPLGRISDISASSILLFLFLSTPVLGQAPPSQVRTVRFIDFYGLRSVSEDQVRSVLGINEGDTLPLPLPSGTELEKRLADIPGVARARLALVCCEVDQLVLFVGIDETPGVRLKYHPQPQGEITVPPEVLGTYRDFLDAMLEAVLSGDAADDESQGHSLMQNPTVRALQERFLVYAEQYLERLRRVLRNSGDKEQRAIAAWVIGYAQDKNAVVEDLLYAVLDANDEVRNNAVRALGAIAALAEARPELRIEIRPDPFIDMLNSLEWTDRNKALMVLYTLTSSRDAEVLEELRQRAFSSLVEMARWKSGYARVAYLILGRVAGLSDGEIHETWENGEREQTVARIIQGAT